MMLPASYVSAPSLHKPAHRIFSEMYGVFHIADFR